MSLALAIRCALVSLPWAYLLGSALASGDIVQHIVAAFGLIGLLWSSIIVVVEHEL